MKAKVNHRYEFVVEKEKNLDMIELKSGIFHILKDNKSYYAEVLKINREEKNFIIRVNGNKYTVQLKDQYDELLEKIGIHTMAGTKVKDLQSPMPGLVMEVRVKEGEEVKEGDGLLVLQAMKMENVIKSPAKGTIHKLYVKKGDVIEKNQTLMSFG